MNNTDLHILILYAIDENPEENYAVFNPINLKYTCDTSKTTVKEFYTDINNIINPCEAPYYCLDI